MKPLTRIAAWVWLAVGVAIAAQGVYLLLRPSPATDVAAAAHHLRYLAILAVLFLPGLAGAAGLVRGRIWGWWVGAVGWGYYLLTFPFIVVATFSGRSAALPLWSRLGRLTFPVIGIAIFVVLVRDPPWRWGSPEGEKYRRVEGDLRPLTVAIAWVWLAEAALRVLTEIRFVSYGLTPNRFGPVHMSASQMWARLSSALAVVGYLAVIAGAAGLIKRRAWGWLVLVLSCAYMIIWNLVTLAGFVQRWQLAGQTQEAVATMLRGGSPAGLVMAVVLAGLSLAGLLADPPHRRLPEEMAPVLPDTGETPVPPTEEEEPAS